MDDLIVVLVATVVLFFLWRGISSKSTASGTPYSSASVIGSVSTALKNVEGQIVSLANTTSKEIGGLSVTVAKNAAQGAYNVSNSHSSTRVVSANLTNANYNDLVSGIKGGVTIPTTYEGIAGAAIGSAPADIGGGILEGFSTAVSTLDKLPVSQQIANLNNSVLNGVSDAGSYLGKQSSNLARWIGL